jgi:hypothetical protein
MAAVTGTLPPAPAEPTLARHRFRPGGPLTGDDGLTTTTQSASPRKPSRSLRLSGRVAQETILAEPVAPEYLAMVARYLDSAGHEIVAYNVASADDDLDAGHHVFARKLADRQSLTIPSEDPCYGDLGQAFPPWPALARGPILQPPKPEIPPSRASSNVPRTATPTGKPQIDTGPVHTEGREVTAMTAIGITGLGLTGTVRMPWVRGSTAPPGTRPKGRKTSARGQDTTEIRAWAKAQGTDVKTAAGSQPNS